MLERLPEMCSIWAEQHVPVGEASRLDRDRGKMPLPHRNDGPTRNAILTIAIEPAGLLPERAARVKPAGVD